VATSPLIMQSFAIMVRIFYFIIFAFVSLIVACFINKYDVVRDQLLLNPEFSSGLVGWEDYENFGYVTTRNKVLVLHSSNAKNRVRVWQRFFVNDKPRHVDLRLQAIVRCENVLEGDKPWNVARLLLLQYIQGEPVYTTAHVVCAFSGSHDWQKVSNTFTLLPECTEFRIIVQMSHCSGSFFLRDLRLSQVKQTALYSWMARAIRIAWIIFVILLFVPWLDFRNAMLSSILVVMTVAVILYGTTMPGYMKNAMKKEVISEIKAGVQNVRDGVQDASDAVIRSKKQQDNKLVPVDITKVAHFVLFGLLGILLRYHRPKRPVRMLILDLFLFSCATELSQLFIDGRTALFSDILIDLTGGMSGCLLAGKRVTGILAHK